MRLPSFGDKANFNNVRHAPKTVTTQKDPSQFLQIRKVPHRAKLFFLLSKTSFHSWSKTGLGWRSGAARAPDRSTARRDAQRTSQAACYLPDYCYRQPRMVPQKIDFSPWKSRSYEFWDGRTFVTNNHFAIGWNEAALVTHKKDENSSQVVCAEWNAEKKWFYSITSKQVKTQCFTVDDSPFQTLQTFLSGFR